MSPITRLLTQRTVATVSKRFNSSTSSATRTRIAEMAAQAERPSAMEAAVPALWAVCGGLTLVAWNRAGGRREEGVVEKLLVV